MRIPLSRIEYDYVFETFLETLPPLLLQAGTLFYTLEPSAYTIKQSKLYFHAPVEFIGKPISVFFDHKKRSIAFYTVIQPCGNGCCLSLPDIAYKYDPDTQPDRVVAEIYVPEIAPITAQEHEAFPLDSIIHTDIQPPSFTDFLPSAYQIALQYMAEGQLAGGDKALVPLFLYRLYEFERQTAAIFNPLKKNGMYALFVDSKMLICGCKDSYAVSIGRRQSVRFALYFPHRTIRITKGRSLFSHFIPKSNTAVVGFLFEDVFEEDKRFLYEHVYHEKYNPAYCLPLGKTGRGA